MYYAVIVDGQVVRCNVADHVPPGTVFYTEPTEEELAQYGIIVVHDALTIPEHNPETHGVADIQPTLGPDGKWHANYVIVEKAPPPPLPVIPREN